MKTHRTPSHPLNDIWRKMIDRCYKLTCKSYKDYGARGIGVCIEWRSSYLCFFGWAEKRWKSGLHIDRLDNDKDYSPDNCQFITQLENNQSCKKRTRSDLSKTTGIPNIIKNNHGTYEVKITIMGNRKIGRGKTLDDAIKLLDMFKNELSSKLKGTDYAARS